MNCMYLVPFLGTCLLMCARSSIAAGNDVPGTDDDKPALAEIGRRWTDSTGKHTVDADYVDFKDGNVYLKKTDGKVIAVPVSALSQKDQDFVNKPAEQIRFAKMILEIDEKADRPGEWYTLEATLKGAEGSIPLDTRVKLLELRIRVKSLALDLESKSGNYDAIARSLAEAMVETELLERTGFTDGMAAIKAKMVVIEHASVSEKTQRLRQAIECLENMALTLDDAVKIVTLQRMVEKATTKELLDARKAATDKLEKALKGEPKYEDAMKSFAALTGRLETKKLRQSRVRRAELLEKATKLYASQTEGK